MSSVGDPSCPIRLPTCPAKSPQHTGQTAQRTFAAFQLFSIWVVSDDTASSRICIQEPYLFG